MNTRERYDDIRVYISPLFSGVSKEPLSFTVCIHLVNRGKYHLIHKSFTIGNKNNMQSHESG